MTGMQCEIGGGGVWRRDKPFSHMLFFPPKTVSRENRTGGGGGGFGCTINHNASIALGFSASSLLFGKLSGIFSNFFCLFRLRFSHLLFRLRKCFFFPNSLQARVETHGTYIGQSLSCLADIDPATKYACTRFCHTFLISWLDNASSARTIGHTGNELKVCTIVLPKKTAFIFEQQSLASKLGIKHL